MLMKNRLLFVKSEEHEFETLIKNLENDFTVFSCKCSYPDIRFNADNCDADLVVCSYGGFERKDIVDLLECMPNMFIFYSANEYADIVDLSSRGFKYYAHDSSMYEEGEKFIRIICGNLPFRYDEFKDKIYKLIFDCNMKFHPGAYRTGFTYAVDSIRYILFSECRRLSFSTDIYTYLANKYNSSVTGVDNAMRRYVRYVWGNRESFKDMEFFPECAGGDEPPLVSDFIFEMCDRIFYKYRQDFYRYFSEVHK